MISKVTVDADQEQRGLNIMRCPVCGQVLIDVRVINGHGTIRAKCRRCGTFNLVDINGVG